MGNLNTSNVQGLKDAFFISKIKILILVSFMGATLLTSCDGDDVSDALGYDCDGNWEEAYDTYYADISAAAAAYSSNPTTENCNTYKQSVERYINAIDDLEDCYPGQYEGDWDEYIKEAREELNSLCD